MRMHLSREGKIGVGIGVAGIALWGLIYLGGSLAQQFGLSLNRTQQIVGFAISAVVFLAGVVMFGYALVFQPDDGGAAANVPVAAALSYRFGLAAELGPPTLVRVGRFRIYRVPVSVKGGTMSAKVRLEKVDTDAKLASALPAHLHATNDNTPPYMVTHNLSPGKWWFDVLSVDHIEMEEPPTTPVS